MLIRIKDKTINYDNVTSINWNISKGKIVVYDIAGKYDEFNGFSSEEVERMQKAFEERYINDYVYIDLTEL